MTITEKYLVRNIYNEIADHFDDTRSYKWNWITDFINYYSSKDILYDIGCGSGRNITPYFDDFPICYGIDNCPKFIEICKNKGLQVYESDMTELPFDTNSADAIISIASFHHLSTTERRIKCLTEIKRIIKPDCKILLSVWSIKQPKKTRRTFTYGDNIVPWNSNGIIYDRYYYIFDINEILKMFKKVGLQLLEYKWNCGNEVFVLTKYE